MDKKAILIIFFNLLAISVSATDFEAQKLHFIYQKLAQPIVGHYKAFKDELMKNLEVIKTYELSESDEDEFKINPALRVKSRSSHPTIPFENDMEEIEILETQTSDQRLLQSVCLNGGQLVQANRTRYFYQGYELSYDNSISLLNGQTITFLNTQLTNINQVDRFDTLLNHCYCPFDYFGRFCQAKLPVQCAINQTIPACPRIDPFIYSFNFTGDAPCTRVRKGSAFNFNARLNCNWHPAYRQWAYEGIKRFQWIVGPSNFNGTYTYSVDRPGFKINNDANSTTLTIEFINFNSLTDKKIFSIDLTARQIAGVDPITYRIPLDASLNKYYSVGNYFYELHITNNIVPDERGTDAAYYNTITDTSYVEPEAGTRINVALAIFLIVLISLIIFFAWWHYRKYKLEQKELAERREYENQIIDEALLERPE